MANPHNDSITFRIKPQEKRPVDNALAQVKNVDGNGRVHVLLDFGGVKPSKFGDGDIARLFASLPQRFGITYVLAFHDKLLGEAGMMAERFKTEATPQANYIIADRNSAYRILSARRF